MRNRKELFIAAKRGDRASFDQLIGENLGLVKKVVWRVVKSYSSAEWEDCYQVGVIGLIKAVKNFDPEKGVAFSTYAYPCIIGEIRRYLQKQNPLKVSEDLARLAVEVKRVLQDFKERNYREPGLEELAEKLDTTPEIIIQALEINRAPVSLEEEVSGEDDSKNLHHYIGREMDFETLNLRNILQKFDLRSRYLVYLRHYKGYSQQETGREMGISQVHVSRLEKKIISELRENIAD